MAKSKADETQADAGAEPQTKPKSRRIRIVVAVAAALVIASSAGGYFALETFAGTPPATSASRAAPANASDPLPVATIASASPVLAKDYEIVSVFGDEAILATQDNLVRVKAGSLAQGLGTITSVEANGDGGGTVVGTEATLRTL